MLAWRPTQAITALFWHVARKRVRARNWLARNWQKHPRAYDAWAKASASTRMGRAIPSDRDKARSHPLITLVPLGGGEDAGPVRQVVKALGDQPFDDWELLLPETCPPLADAIVEPARVRRIPQPEGQSFLESAIAQATGDFVLPLQSGAVLDPSALLFLADAVHAHPDADLVYADQDCIDERGRLHTPWWKPEFDQLMLLSQDYVSSSCLFSRSAALAFLPLSPDEREVTPFALALKLTASPEARVVHVPRPLFHYPAIALEAGVKQRLLVTRGHLASQGAEVEPGPFGSLKVRWPLPPTLPLVSILIPTRDKIDLLRTCIDSILEKTTYPAYEIIVIDNNSQEQSSLEYFFDICDNKRICVLRDERIYNYSQLNNFAAAKAKGDYLCLLNNDTEVISPDWLTDMMRHAVRPGVGAIGAKLLYGNGRIQHAGVVIGMGNAAGHAHRHLDDSDCGYFAQAHVARQATAVTAACLVVSRRNFDAVGGLDEAQLAIAYNDVDFCLKLRKAGLMNVYEPRATLYHHESLSRGDDLSAEHRKRYFAELSVLQERWQTSGYLDPTHHPMLDPASEQYVTRLSAPE